MVEQLRDNPKTLATVLLLTVTAAWGATFVVVKDAVAHMAVLGFLGWRFLIATAILAGFRPRALARLDRKGWAHGLLLGVTLAGGYVLQTVGLVHTSAALSGFLTGLQVVFTPLLMWLLLRQRPARRVWVATALATAGLGVISLRGVAFGTGEALTLASAAVFGLQIVGLGRWSRAEQTYGLATVQLLTVGVICFAAGLPGSLQPPPGASAWGAVLLTAVAATAFAFVVQTWAQSQLSTSHATVIMAMEPVFAALVAGLAGEALGWPVLVGGALVVVAMLVVEVAGNFRRAVRPVRPPGPALPLGLDEEAAGTEPSVEVRHAVS